MRRVLAFALVLWLGNTSAALAGETLLASATRLAREAARSQAPSRTSSDAAMASARESASRSTLAFGQRQPALVASGMSRRTKVLIWLAAGVGFAATAYTIDHKVQDNTPSSLGTRKD
ncbi:MAG: hypothetical protein HY047_20930 [Acidobacteria bacterium]|nr:hypothetical protein [Acidobacteriota bacterium]